MPPYEFTPNQANHVRSFYKYLFAIFALLSVLHVGFIGSTLPYVYSDQEASICGARKLISFLSHRLSVIAAVFLISSAVLLCITIISALSFQTRVYLITAVALCAMTTMLVTSCIEIRMAAKLPLLPQDVHNCAYPNNAASWD